MRVVLIRLVCCLLIGSFFSFSLLVLSIFEVPFTFLFIICHFMCLYQIYIIIKIVIMALIVVIIFLNLIIYIIYLHFFKCFWFIAVVDNWTLDDGILMIELFHIGKGWKFYWIFLGPSLELPNSMGSYTNICHLHWNLWLTQVTRVVLTKYGRLTQSKYHRPVSLQLYFYWCGYWYYPRQDLNWLR